MIIPIKGKEIFFEKISYSSVIFLYICENNHDNRITLNIKGYEF